MKRFAFLLLFELLAWHSSSQTVDSLAVVNEVDSLISLNRELVKQKQYDQAFKIIEAAEQKAETAFGKNSASYAACVHRHARTFLLTGNLDEAEKRFLEAKEIRSKVIGKDNLDYSSTILALGEVYYQQHQYEKAESQFLKAKTIREKLLGKEDEDYLSCINRLGLLYWEMGRLKKSEPLQLELKAAYEKKGFQDSLAYARALSNLALLYKDLDQYDKSEPLFLQALPTLERWLGKDNADYASSLNNLAALYLKMRQYEKSEALFLQSKAIREKALGKNHPYYAASLNNLAALYSTSAQYEKAIPLFEEAIAILGRNNKLDPQYADDVKNLAIVYNTLGQYEKAELLYLETRDIQEQITGKNNPDYAASLRSLAGLYTEMGLYKKAEALLMESKSILEQTLGKDSPDYADYLDDLAILYTETGQYEKAESLFLDSKAIREQLPGANNPENTHNLYCLAQLYYSTAKFDKAIPLFLEVKNRQEKILGKDHPYYASTLTNLANVYAAMGQNEQAESMYLEANAIQEKVLGDGHHDYAQTLNNLASIYSATGHPDKAESFFTKAIQLDIRRLLLALNHLSEQEMNQYIATFVDNQDNIFIFNQITNDKTGISKLCYDNTLFTKGFLLNAYNQSKQLLLSNPATTDKYLQLKSCDRLLAAEYSKPISERNGVTELEEKSNALEKELASLVAGYGLAMKQVSWSEVQQKLKPGEAAIEFVRYHNGDTFQGDSAQYAALVLRPGDKQPHFVLLFEEKSLDSLLLTKSNRKADYVNSLYTLADRGAIAIEAPRRSLVEMLWNPLEKSLEGVKTIYYSPTGLLHRINLDAIPISETETLADKYHLIALNSTRELVVPNQMNQKNNDAVLFGGIQFDRDSALQAADPMLAMRSRGELSFSAVDSTLRGGTWNYLPGTEREVTSLEKIMQAAGVNPTLKKGYAASEEYFKSIGANNTPSPRILHIATHGFFFPDPKSIGRALGQEDQNEPVFKVSDHPMLRSGLILAGGNVGWQGKQSFAEREDGILTAYEISQMNLSNTELVVLSACETGLGDIQGNEGVYGLQRAFKIAGAKYLIMSLWQVPDKQTSLLMTTFYKKWLEEKMSIPDAFHAAQKELREAGLDPYQWAGFVLVE